MKDKSKKSTYSTTFGVDPIIFDFLSAAIDVPDGIFSFVASYNISNQVSA